MATTLHLASYEATASRGADTNGQAGTAKSWTARYLGLYASNSTSTASATTAGATSGIEVGTTALEWISPPLAAAGTVSGTVSFSIIAHESANNANATIAIRIDRLDNTCGIASTLTTSSFGTEVSTSAAARTWSVVPTSTTFSKGDRIRVVPFFDDATGVTMGSGPTVTLTYGGTASTLQDSTVTFTENLSFQDAIWELRPTAATNSLNGIARSENEDLWVVAGASGMIQTSSDAVTWTQRTSGSTGTLYCVARSEAKDLWVVVGGAPTILTSPDGTTWTSRTAPTATWRGVARSENDDLWVAVGTTGSIATSTDAITWTSQTSGTTVQLNAVARSDANDLWVAVGNSGRILTSSDGTTWTSQTSGTTNGLVAVTYAASHGLWIVAGSGLTILTSTDGTTWTSRADTSGGTFNDVKCVGSTCVVAGNFSVAFTTNGTTYTQGSMHPLVANPTALAYSQAEDIWVASTSAGYVQVTAGDGYGYTSPQRVFLTDTASDIVDQGLVEKELWTTRGSG